MINALTNFLSSKLNLMIMIFISYLIIAYSLSMFDMTLKQQALIFFCVMCVGFLNHLLGVSKGLFIATLHRKEIDEFVKYMDNKKDQELEDLIEHIEKKYNEEKDEEK